MSDVVRIEVQELTGSTVHTLDGFESYSLTSSMMQGADSFQFAFAPTKTLVKLFKSPGQTVRVYVGDSLQLTGIVDTVPYDAGSDGLKCSIQGRDMGGLLVDALPLMLTFQGQTIEQIATRLTDTWRQYIRQVIVDNTANRNGIMGRTGGKMTKSGSGITSERKRTLTRTRPEDRVWDILANLAQEQGCHVWTSAQGDVVIAQPDYASTSPYGAGLYIVCNDDMEIIDANCRIRHAPSIANRASHYVVLGQGAPDATATGKSLTELKHVVRDPSPAFWTKPTMGGLADWKCRLEKMRHQSVQNVEDVKHVRRVGRQRMQILAAQGYGMVAIVPEHRPWTGGPIYTVDSQIPVRFDPRGIADQHYIVGRTLKYDASEGRTTELQLYPTGLWLAANDADEGDDAFDARMRRAVVC